MSHRPSRRRQRGITLLMSMIFLVLLTLIVVSAMKVANVNSKVVGNVQRQKEAGAAAQQAIETVISTDFTASPRPATISVDINDSGQAASTYTVDMPAPACTGVKPIKSQDLDAANPDDQACLASGAGQNTGIIGAGPTGNSLCSNSNWEINGAVTPPNASLPVNTTHQGIAVRVAVGADC